LDQGEFCVKKIVYIHQYYNTPQQGGSLRSYYLSNILVKDGFEVHLITAHNQNKYNIEVIEGVQVHYLPVYYENKMGFYNRLKSFILFTFKSLFLAIKLKPELIYATSTPLTVGITPLVLSYIKKTPYIFEVRDLWPKAPIEMGYIKNILLIKLSTWLEKSIYKRALGIVALSKGMYEHIQKVVPKATIACITNMADTQFFKPNLKTEKKTNSTLTISYIGNSGPVNNLTNLIKLADYLQLYNHDTIKINIAARGKELYSLKKTCQKLNLKNIHFLEYLDKAGVRDLLKNSDFTYLTFKDIPSLRVASPNKLFDSFAAGVPVISAINGWWAEDLKQYQCGLEYNPNNPSQLYQALLSFIDNPDLLKQYKKNAFFLAHSKFSQEKLSKEFLIFIKKTILA
jgi:glycosyltransferase involved in cell wall biosynthesis